MASTQPSPSHGPIRRTCERTSLVRDPYFFQDDPPGSSGELHPQAARHKWEAHEHAIGGGVSVESFDHVGQHVRCMCTCPVYSVHTEHTVWVCAERLVCACLS